MPFAKSQRHMRFAKKSYRHAVRKKSRRWMRFKKEPAAHAGRKAVGQPQGVMEGHPKASARNDGGGLLSGWRFGDG
jgi:hypothetical protein